VNERARQQVRQKEQRRSGSSLNLPFPVTLVRDDHGVEEEWVATVDALAGCSARARTPEEALDGVAGAVAEWLEAAGREGRDVPDPKALQSHSGRLLLRMPQTLHAELTRVAERESVSLNQFITDILAGALGWRVPPRVGRIATTPVQAVRPRTVGDGEMQLTGEPESPPPQTRSIGFVTAALVVNFVLVAVAAIVAIVVLIAAWL
jgi:antitoxin HicB